jgi:hypothetical protein
MHACLIAICLVISIGSVAKRATAADPRKFSVELRVYDLDYCSLAEKHLSQVKFQFEQEGIKRGIQEAGATCVFTKKNGNVIGMYLGRRTEVELKSSTEKSVTLEVVVEDVWFSTLFQIRRVSSHRLRLDVPLGQTVPVALNKSRSKEYRVEVKTTVVVGEKK